MAYEGQERRADTRMILGRWANGPGRGRLKEGPEGVCTEKERGRRPLHAVPFLVLDQVQLGDA